MPLDARRIGAYVAVVFALTWALDAWLYLQGGLKAPFFQAAAAVQMLLPALVAVAFRLGFKEGFANSGLRLGRKRYYGVALALFVGWLAVTAGLSALTPWWGWDVGFTQIEATLRPAAEAAGQALPPIGPGLVAALGAQMVLVGALLGLPALLGEEYGWRGYLLPHLRPLGAWPALLTHGVIWGLWHAPLILMGYNYPGHPIAGVLGMVVFSTLAGIILAWLYDASGSIFVPSFAHGVINQGAAFLFLVVAERHPLLTGPLGAVGLAVLAAIVAGLATTGRLRLEGQVAGGTVPPKAAAT